MVLVDAEGAGDAGVVLGGGHGLLDAHRILGFGALDGVGDEVGGVIAEGAEGTGLSIENLYSHYDFSSTNGIELYVRTAPERGDGHYDGREWSEWQQFKLLPFLLFVYLREYGHSK